MSFHPFRRHNSANGPKGQAAAVPGQPTPLSSLATGVGSGTGLSGRPNTSPPVPYDSPKHSRPAASPGMYEPASPSFQGPADAQQLEVQLGEGSSLSHRHELQDGPSGSTRRTPSPRSPRVARSPGKHGQARSRSQSPDADFDPYGPDGLGVGGPPSSVRSRKVSPLSKRLGEDVPFMLPHPSRSKASAAMPGVVIGTFAGGGGGTGMGFGVDESAFDGSMDDVMDPSAAPASSARGDSAIAPAPNIAPWLMDDPGAAPTDRSAPNAAAMDGADRGGQSSGLNKYSSVPTLPKIRRQETSGSAVDSEISGSSSRSGSHPNIYPAGSNAPSGPGTPTGEISRNGSTDSGNTLNNGQTKAGLSPTTAASALPGGVGRHASIANAQARAGTRFGSAASNGSGPGSVGRLFGLLKKGNKPMNSEFGNLDGSHRGSTASGSASSRTSAGAASQTSIPRQARSALRPQESFNELRPFQSSKAPYIIEDSMISPHEEREGFSFGQSGSETGFNGGDVKGSVTDDFNLDLDLDNMEGIVDPNLANAPVIPAVPYRGPNAGSGLTEADGSAGGGRDGPTGLNDLGLRDALYTTHDSGSDSRSGSEPQQAGPSRVVVGEADRAGGPGFSRNPFSGSVSSNDSKPSNPPSPHSPLSYSPKHNLPLSTVPRRPSQLRNVKMGSLGSDSSSSDGQLQPLAPAWASSAPPGRTVFQDPFGPTQGVDGVEPSSDLSQGPELSTQPSESSVSPTPRNDSIVTAGTADGKPSLSVPPSHTASIAALNFAGPSAAWAAPESWGVEADAQPDDGTSSSSEESVTEENGVPGGAVSPTDDGLAPLTGAGKGKPPPFGFKSRGSGADGRPKTASSGGPRSSRGQARPSTALRPGTRDRPTTSGSTVSATGQHHHWLRIWRADGSYEILSFPFLTTTAEIVNMLQTRNANDRKASNRMWLYLREKGQDRQLLPHERPLVIQERRLHTAGFVDPEFIELGKEDLAILMKVIYQTPPLPVIDPDEESSYDSFEFIDLGGRDLHTIPIFLHLHADNIIILNVSRNPMQDLPLDFVQACASLKELRMTNMALKRVPVSLRHSTTLARLDVSCNRIADLEAAHLHECPTLLSLKLQNNRITSLPSWFDQLKALKYLNISNNKFEEFPSVLCEMSNLVDLDVSFNNILELPSEMSNLKSLERLAVYGNDIHKLPDSFSTLANLRVLDVRRNKLTDLTPVYALPNLTDLQADYNDLVTLDAQIGAKVRQFSVPHNSITRFTLAPLKNMEAVTYSLTHLNLSHGKISTLADEAFSGLINLVELKLDHNQFTRLPPTIGRLTNLQVFSCTDNSLNTLPEGFGKMTKLRSFNIHNNNVSRLPGDLWACGYLEVFNASSNLLDHIEEVPEDLKLQLAQEARKGSAVSTDFAMLPPAGRSLQKLYFGDNRFTDEVFAIAPMCPNLRILNLSFNDIYEIPPFTLSRSEKLEQLYLSGNKLTSLPSEDLDKLQNLKVLHLNGNKLQTLPSELGAIKGLQHLDVGSNVLKYNIANWPYDWNWNWNTSLRYLNLSGNKRLEIKPTSAHDMNHSSIRKELSDFTSLTQLRLLGLMDVTVRIPSLPDESEEKRIRTSFSDVNNMAYGISDALGAVESMGMFDLVVPNFRGKDNECVFGMFGRHAPTLTVAGRIPKLLQENFSQLLAYQLSRLPDTGGTFADALRKAFLTSNRKTFEKLEQSTKGRKGSTASFDSIGSMFHSWLPGPGSVFRTGAAGAVVYLVDKTMYVGNVGDHLVVLSRKGEAELLSKAHDPTDRDETRRLRKAEAWVSTKGFVNDDKDMDISRAIGYWSNFPAVNADPEIRTRELDESDEFVIIGNAALWKCCSYQTAVDIARTEKDDPMLAAQKLRDFAIGYGADGNIMVMIVNISDLFYGRGSRSRGGPGLGQQSAADAQTDGDGYFAASKRNIFIRRRYEEVGDRTLNRLQQEIEPPQGQVAIVFTDIVNSTVLWETNPGMPTAIKMHHSLMRRQLRLDGGYEVKTEGDSFMVSFQTVTAALLWAFNCQIGLLTLEWPRELLEAPDGRVVYDAEGNLVQRGLRVRMGIHWGSPQCERDPITRRMDYYGPMVNRAARIQASADGGQLMASQDVINELTAIREYLATLGPGEAGVEQAEVPPEMKREVLELRRIGLEIRDMGERKLKGLEVPEKLHLLYPRTLAGRFELQPDLNANVEVTEVKITVPRMRLIDIEQVRQLSKLVLRLEAVSSGSSSTSAAAAGPGASAPGMASRQTSRQVAASPTPSRPVSPRLDAVVSAPLSPTAVSRRMQHGPSRGVRLPPPSYLGPRIEEDMGDEELEGIIEALTGRAENCLSTLYLKNLGEFATVLSALEQATRIDNKLLLHAMSLMSGALSSRK